MPISMETTDIKECLKECGVDKFGERYKRVEKIKTIKTKAANNTMIVEKENQAEGTDTDVQINVDMEIPEYQNHN
jgi:hypothetical protein